MPEARYSLGVDFGTNSVRALIVDTADGRELATAVADYQFGDAGVYLDARDPNLARQNPLDYETGFVSCVKQALSLAESEPGFSPEKIIGIGTDTTGSTPIPVDEGGTPLSFDPRWTGNLDAMAWLWKDHTSFAEAAEITALAKKQGVPYLRKCGSTYSSEWFWSKILHCARTAPDVFASAYSWVECQDYVPAWLTGQTDPEQLIRGICAAGHKAMFHESWGGLPSKRFLNALDPRLGELKDRLYDSTSTSDKQAGRLTVERALEVGLSPGTPVAVGAFDAHLGAVGSGIKPGVMVKIIGTSTCDIMVGNESTPDIPGVCGVVPGSVVPGMMGVEAGQSAVGDLFNWCVAKLGQASHEELTNQASALQAGESGLLALDWNNGNRTVLVDPLLTGLIIGQTLQTGQAEIYRALIEATAFGARKIIEQIEAHGVLVQEIIMCGGIAEKSPLVMQIYSDVCNRPLKTSRSAQTCALGAAICGAVVGGAHPDIPAAIEAMTGVKERIYCPCEKDARTYDRLYRLYLVLHDAFGRPGLNPDMSGVMKELIALRKETRES